MEPFLFSNNNKQRSSKMIKVSCEIKKTYRFGHIVSILLRHHQSSISFNIFMWMWKVVNRANRSFSILLIHYICLDEKSVIHASLILQCWWCIFRIVHKVTFNWDMSLMISSIRCFSLSLILFSERSRLVIVQNSE